MTTAMYIGRPENGLIPLARLPLPDMPRSADLGAYIHRLLNGSNAVDRKPRACRTWTLSWEWLTDAERRDLAALADQQYGPGPYVLLDPAARNLLTAQQASGTDKARDGSGHTVAAGETLASSDTWAARGVRSLRWSLPSPVTSGVLVYDPPPSLPGIPVVAGQPYTFACRVRGGGADPNITVAPVLSWMAADGWVQSSDIGAPTVLADTPAQLAVTRLVPPAGAVWLRAELRVDPTTVDAASSAIGQLAELSPAWVTSQGLRGAGEPILTDWMFAGQTSDVYVDEAQLAMSATVDGWMPGEGVPVVSITEMPETVPLVGNRDLSITFVEVG